MAAHDKKQLEVNLLPQEEFDSSTKGRILHWLLGAFRYIIIVTELIVVMAFISRFYFDSKLADLNDEIEQKSAYITSQKPLEDNFRQTQTRLNIFGEMSSPSNKVSPILEDVVNRLPSDVSLTQLSIDEKNMALIQAETLSDLSIQQFLVNLSSSPNFQNVSLTQVESRSDSPEIKFTITADVVEGGQQ